MTNKISLRAARVNAGLTQTEAAAKIGVARETISNWETGVSFPSTKKLKIIEEVYGISYEKIKFSL